MNRRGDGFTLIELLIALGIFAVLAALAYGGLRSVLASSGRTGAHMERLAQIQRTMARLTLDIEQAADRPIRDRFGKRRAAVMTTANSPSRLELTHGGLANPADLPRSRLQRVAYYLDGERFIRERWNSLDQAPGAVASPQLLTEAVQSVTYRFLHADGGWSRQWPPEGGAGLPRGIEVTFEITGAGTIRRLLVPRG